MTTTYSAADTAHSDHLVMASRDTCSDVGLFAGQWLKEPGRIGAVAPSSVHFARAATSTIPEHGQPTVVELGPGTGPFTAEIQRRLGGRGQHIAIESNAVLADNLQRQFPRVQVFAEDAAGLPNILSGSAIESVDVIISGLPWALFPAPTQQQLIDAIVDVLGPQGVFTTFAYRHAAPLAAARRFRNLLTDHFEEVAPSRTIWRNLPPAFVFHARRARPRPAR